MNTEDLRDSNNTQIHSDFHLAAAIKDSKEMVEEMVRKRGLTSYICFSH